MDITDNTEPHRKHRIQSFHGGSAFWWDDQYYMMLGQDSFLGYGPGEHRAANLTTGQVIRFMGAQEVTACVATVDIKKVV